MAYTLILKKQTMKKFNFKILEEGRLNEAILNNITGGAVGSGSGGCSPFACTITNFNIDCYSYTFCNTDNKYSLCIAGTDCLTACSTSYNWKG